MVLCGFFKQKTSYEMRISDWSSDVCSSDHHARDLRDALGAHIRLIEEDAPEMVAVGKDLVLMRQVRAARIDEIDAGQAVRLGDLLRAEMLLDGHRIIGAAFYRRVVAHDHRLPPRYAPDARDHPRARNLAAIHVARRKLADQIGRAHV